MLSIYHQNAIKATWQNLFSLYHRVPGVAPAWYRSLLDGSDTPTGDPLLDRSLTDAWRQYTKP